MPIPVQGVGSLTVSDLLTDISYKLFEPVVNTAVPAPGLDVGVQTVPVWDASLYVGAQIVVGANTANVEVVTVSAVVVGTSFTATFENTHAAGDTITGPTFPVQSVTGDLLFTQLEMLGYISEAMNDFLLRVPLVYAVTDSISMPPTTQFTGLPDDCMQPVRVAASFTAAGLYPLRETSQANLDSYDYRWPRQTVGVPQVYYRDKIGLNQFGIWPVQNNTVPTEIIYAQRSAQLLGLGDGFLVPDVFTPVIKARVLEFAYSKDGEQRSPGMAKFWGDRYETGVRIAGAILQVIEDPNMQ